MELKKFSIIPEIVLTEKEKAVEDFLVKMKKSKGDNDKLFFDGKNYFLMFIIEQALFAR